MKIGSWRRNLAMVAIVPLVVATATAAAAASDPGKAETSRASGCDRGRFGVIVDVGHTPQSPGADSARGTTEFEFNLRLALKIERGLVHAGFTRAKLMVTEGKSRPGLMQRIARANGSAAGVLLSIHHDSVPEKFKQAWEFGGRARTYSDRFSGHSLFVSSDGSQYGASLLFGKFLGNELRAHGLLYTPHYIEKIMGNRKRLLVDHEAGVYRYDQLLVLKRTRMPAVLLEAGMIVNRDDELVLAEPERHAAISAAVADAVEAFCEVRAVQRPVQDAISAQIAQRPAAKLKRSAKIADRITRKSTRTRLSSRSTH